MCSICDQQLKLTFYEFQFFILKNCLNKIQLSVIIYSYTRLCYLKLNLTFLYYLNHKTKI